MTFASVAVATTKVLFGISDCTVNRDARAWNLHVCGNAHVRSHVSPGTDWSIFLWH